MSTWAQVLSTGRGTVRYRLEIEGWPEVFVTDERITFTNRATRTVLPGLLHEGLKLSERIVMREGKTMPNSQTFKIRPVRGSRTATQSTDPLTTSFAQFVKPIAILNVDVSDSAETGWTLEGGVSLDDTTYYHIGTETIYVDSWAGQQIDRAQWGTAPQSHSYSQNNVQSQDVYIYTRPPTMEGRRCRLYAYGDADAGTGDGTCIWRGIVMADPSIDQDGITWIINAQPVTRVLKQNIAGALGVAKPLGVFHNNSCAIKWSMLFNATAEPDEEDETKIAKWCASEEDLFTYLNTVFADALAILNPSPYTGGRITSLKIGRAFDGSIRLTAKIYTTLTVNFGVQLQSLLLGGTPSKDLSVWRLVGTGTTSTGLNFGIGADYLSAGEWYQVLLPPADFTNLNGGYDFEWDGAGALIPVGMLTNLGRRQKSNLEPYTVTEGALAANTPWRIYINQDWDFPGVAGSAVHISDSFQRSKTFKIAATGDEDTYSYIELAPLTRGIGDHGGGIEKGSWQSIAAGGGFVGMLSDATDLTLVRDYGSLSIADFINNLEGNATLYANDGDAPFITTADLASFSNIISTSRRRYQFTEPVSVEDVLASELQYVGAFMRINATGLISAIHYPTFNDLTACDAAHTLTTATILTPQNGEGMWPQWDPQRDGRVTEVVIVPGGPEEGAHKFKFRTNLSNTISKTRGISRAEIRPKSAPDEFTGSGVEFDYARELAEKFFQMFAREYAAVTVAVPFVHFSVLCGDVVSVTHPLIPDGLGNRGVSGRRGIVIERKWNLDPAQKDAGELTILIPLIPGAGYAPAGVITEQTNTSGNIWDLTLSLANAFNIALAPSGSTAGQVLDSFAVNDRIRIVKCDTLPAATSAVIGTITALNAAAGTCTVSLGAAWTPSTLVWRLEFDNGSSGVTTNQAKYAYVAGVDGLDVQDNPGDTYA